MDIDGHWKASSGAVRAALVADLAHTTVPTCIMGCTLVGIAAYAHVSTGIDALHAAALAGGVASIAKIILTQIHKRSSRIAGGEHSDAGLWEKLHALTTSSVAITIGATSTLMFLQPDITLQMIATGLIFGYCSGIVSRVGIRPKIAITALVLAASPPIIAAALWNDVPHLIIAAVFLVFLLGSFDSVRHVHWAAVKHVSMRLRMASLAHTDPLTGLANRSGLTAAFEAIDSNNPIAILCLDLDGFKSVNDRFGHAAGDTLLRMVAERILLASGADATVVRMGGDEFVVLQSGSHCRYKVEKLSEQIDFSLSEPFMLDRGEVRISASVGHSFSPTKPVDLEGLLGRADEASYRMKSYRAERLLMS